MAVEVEHIAPGSGLGASTTACVRGGGSHHCTTRVATAIDADHAAAIRLAAVTVQRAALTTGCAVRFTVRVYCLISVSPYTSNSDRLARAHIADKVRARSERAVVTTSIGLR
jgi:hypothetical protein